MRGVVILKRAALFGALVAVMGAAQAGSQGPYGGTAVAVPGTLQAEDFDTGGPGVAYQDGDSTNNGGQYRPSEQVDIEATADTGGGYNVGWIAAGEWLEYTVDVREAGTYTVEFRVASEMSGGALHLEKEGVALTATVSAPQTGGWQTWTTVTATGVSLSSGVQVLRVVFDGGPFNLNWIRFSLSGSGGGGDPGGGTGSGWWRTSGNKVLDEAGREIRWSGVNWHGMDSENRIPHGLWGGTGHTIERHLDEMKNAGFNLIRLPFSGDIFPLDTTYPRQEAIDSTVNADLLNKTCGQILDRLVSAAGQRGIRIILDYHRVHGGSAPESGLWYSSSRPESQWIENWKALVTRYRTNPTVVGVDLFNEVHGSATWEADNVNPSVNWRWAAKRCAEEILRIHPNLLICVQGMHEYNGEAGWWGGVHLGVRDHPLTLSVANRLVYEVHDYGPIVWDQPFHQYSAGFPDNLPAHWDRQWGFLHKENIAPVWVGEWGSFLTVPSSRTDISEDKRTRERLWAEKLRAYIQENGLSWTWWCWTPESHDTGGVLKDDYSGLNTEKVTFVSSVTYPGFGSSTGGTGGGGGTGGTGGGGSGGGGGGEDGGGGGGGGCGLTGLEAILVLGALGGLVAGLRRRRTQKSI